jgi:hypothetical protein
VVVGAQLSQPTPRDPSFDGGPIELIRETYEELYPVFCVYRSMSQGQRAGLWNQKYQFRWVRWTGKIKSFTPKGITLQMRPQTVTFDLSVWLEDGQMPRLRAHHKRGDVVTFIARLDTYDEIFQKLYLTHGAVVDSTEPIPDLGF